MPGNAAIYGSQLKMMRLLTRMLMKVFGETRFNSSAAHQFNLERRMKMAKFNFKTREEYLKWRVEWKAEYKELSREIRQLKCARKEYIWKYRPKDDNASKRRTKVGPNPNYNTSASWKAASKSYRATVMLETLKEAKIEAGKQRAARLAAESEAA